jgi:transcriptional regulator with XRE-family HTH domain
MGDSSVFTRRLKEARLRAGLSQEQLGVLAGIDEFSASARMNQYERGKHVPDLATMDRIAQALGVPTPYLVTGEDDLAEMLLIYSGLDERGKERLLAAARGLT